MTFLEVASIVVTWWTVPFRADIITPTLSTVLNYMVVALGNQKIFSSFIARIHKVTESNLRGLNPIYGNVSCLGIGCSNNVTCYPAIPCGGTNGINLNTNPW